MPCQPSDRWSPLFYTIRSQSNLAAGWLAIQLLNGHIIINQWDFPFGYQLSYQTEASWVLFKMTLHWIFCKLHKSLNILLPKNRPDILQLRLDILLLKNPPDILLPKNQPDILQNCLYKNWLDILLSKNQPDILELVQKSMRYFVAKNTESVFRWKSIYQKYA